MWAQKIKKMSFRIKLEFHVHIHWKKNNKEVDQKDYEDGMGTKTFCMSAIEEIERLKLMMSRSTIENYLTALRSFQDFLLESSSDDYLDSDLFRQYEHWLHNRMVKPNTISCYMRSLRSLVTKIYGDDGRCMFKHVYTGLAATDKRSISVEEIVKLRNLRLKEGSFLSLTRDLFLFSFYAFGMPFVDMAFFQRSQISDGKFTYYRHKTGQQVTVKIEACMQEIIERYQGNSDLYVFPLIHATNPHDAYDEYLKMLNHYNRALKSLAKIAGVDHQLTSYVTRHSWASIAYDNNIDLSVISKALGHANPQHTLIYIRQINDSRLYDANQQILEKALKNKT